EIRDGKAAATTAPRTARSGDPGPINGPGAGGSGALGSMDPGSRASRASGERSAEAIAAVRDVMARLRAKDGGGPWDVEQTFATIAPYTIEEAYEVADAIAREDRTGLKEELGDLLFQVAFHARMAEEEGAFDFADVAFGLAAKMKARHPHVFGDADMRSS